jgi:lipooligosaccharide transport system permease protein
MCFTAAAPSIDFFNYPSFLFLSPMFFLCGTFFPLTSLPSVAQGIAIAVLPLTHVVNVVRGLVTGGLEHILGFSTQMLLLISIVWLVLVTVFFFILSINLMKKRLVG